MGTANIKIQILKKFLKKQGCVFVRINAGHEIWQCPKCTRPIVFQTHIDPIPEFIILQILRTLNISKKDFEKIINAL